VVLALQGGHAGLELSEFLSVFNPDMNLIQVF
jgi:hypothetical protein